MLGNADLCQSEEVQQRAMEEAARAGLLDMYGRNIPSIDGFGRSIKMCIRDRATATQPGWSITSRFSSAPSTIVTVSQ